MHATRRATWSRIPGPGVVISVEDNQGCGRRSTASSCQPFPVLCRSIKSSAQENEPTSGKLSTRGYKDRGENWFIIGQRRAIVVFSVRHETRQCGGGRGGGWIPNSPDVSSGSVFDA